MPQPTVILASSKPTSLDHTRVFEAGAARSVHFRSLLCPTPDPESSPACNSHSWQRIGIPHGIFCSNVKEILRAPGLQQSLPALREAKRVFLVRHGQSTWNEEGHIRGSSDYSVLTSKGEYQAETSRQMLLTDSFDACFTSPLIRSRRTAEIIWGTRNKELIAEPDLREIDLYSFQGLLKHEGKQKFGDAYRQWQKDAANFNTYRQWQKDAANFNIDGHYPVREL